MIHSLIILDDNNLTHNNIQLSSILLDKNKNIKLSKFGFGFETVIELLTENEEYIAPEVYDDNKFTHLSDVYSLGNLMLKLMGVTVRRDKEDFFLTVFFRILMIWMILNPVLTMNIRIFLSLIQF